MRVNFNYKIFSDSSLSLLNLEKAGVSFMFGNDIIRGSISFLFGAVNIVNFRATNIAKDMVKETFVNVVARESSKE